MSTDKLVQSLGNRLNRRNILVKTGMGMVGALAAAMGVSREAGAQEKCCGLCYPPDPNCPGEGCACVWCWYCLWSGDGNYYACCECHGSTADCGDDCNNVKCSWTNLYGPYRPQGSYEVRQ